MASDVSEQFQTLSAVAGTLGVNRLTIRRWMQAGKVQYQRIGGIVLIEKAEVERLKGGPMNSQPGDIDKFLARRRRALVAKQKEWLDAEAYAERHRDEAEAQATVRELHRQYMTLVAGEGMEPPKGWYLG